MGKENSSIFKGMAFVIQNFLNEKQKTSCPFPEEESYRLHSTHCTHHQNLTRLQLSLFIVNEETRKVLSEVEKYYHIAYVYSAIYDQVYHLSDKKWFHEPWWGMVGTFNLLWEGNSYHLGLFLQHEEFVNDPSIIKIHKKWLEMDNVSETLDIPKQSWKELLAIIKKSKESIARKIQEDLNK